MRRRADGRQDVGGQGQVQHLLLDHGDQRLFPGLHPGELVVSQALIRPALERELRVQVLTHQAVLDLAGLTQQVHQLLPGIHPERRLSQRIVRDVSGHGYHLTYESSSHRLISWASAALLPGYGRLAAGCRYRSHGRAGPGESPSCEPVDIDPGMLPAWT